MIINKYRCLENLELMEMDNEWLVINPETLTITKINDVGSMIVEGLIKAMSFEEIVEKIQNEYDVEVEKATSDLITFINQLIEAGLVINEQ